MKSRLSPWLTVFVLLLALPVLAATSNWEAGTWVAVVDEKELNLTLHPKGETGSQSSLSAPFSAFQGLSTAEGSSAPFKLVREAGTFDFQGRFTEQQGIGTWKFSPDATYTKKLAELGLASPKANEQTLLALFDVGPKRIQALKAEGIQVTSTDELLQVGIFKITPEYARELAKAGYPKLTLEKLLQSRIHGVTAERIQGLASEGFKGLPFDTLLAMNIHGVAPDFIREMRGLGFKDLDADTLVSLRIHGVTPAFVKEMRAQGFTGATAEDFVSLRIHGIDSAFIRSVSKPKAQGEKPSPR
jgi:hypothetical protein